MTNLTLTKNLPPHKAVFDHKRSFNINKQEHFINIFFVNISHAEKVVPLYTIIPLSSSAVMLPQE